MNIKGAVAIVCLTALEIVAMLTDNNGHYLVYIVGVIAGLGGFSIGKVVKNGT